MIFFFCNVLLLLKDGSLIGFGLEFWYRVLVIVELNNLGEGKFIFGLNFGLVFLFVEVNGNLGL